jgi:hypothetical protein
MSTSTTARKPKLRETHQSDETNPSIETPLFDEPLPPELQSRRPKRNTRKDPSPPQPRPQNLPIWAPDAADLDVVPPEVQQAITDLLQPFYEQYVVNASDGMEKSLGITVVHLLWLELLEQFDIRNEYITIEAVLHTTHDRPEMIDRHLRLIDSKLRVGYFLLRLKELKQQLAVRPQLPYPALPQSDDPIIIPTGIELDRLSNSRPQPPSISVN